MTVIKGAKELSAKLKRLSGSEGKKLLRKGLREGTKVIAAEARAIAPQASGELKRSIKTRALKRKKGRIGFRVTSRLPYSVAQQYGWKHHKTKQAIEGTEFMSEAAEKNEEKVIANIDDKIEKTIKGII